MKRFLFTMLVIALIVPFSALAKAQDFHEQRKLEWLSDAQDFAKRLMTIRAQADELQKRWFSGFQDGSTYDLIVTTSCGDGSAYEDETTCEAAGFYWDGAACIQGDTCGTSFEGLSEAEIHNYVGSIQNLVDTWFGTAGNGNNIYILTE